MRNWLIKTFPVTSHTDYVGQNSTFVAIKGATSNGIEYIEQALEKGATIIVVQNNNVICPELQKKIKDSGAKLELVENARIALAQLSAQAADNPAQKLKIYAITGTKGKTTTAFLLRSLFRGAGYKTAMLSTAQNYIEDKKINSDLTTPQPDYIHQFLKMCVSRDITNVVIEVSAQALSLHRVHGIFFDGVIFTNFAHEHLEFYNNLDDYFAAKKLIFKQIKKSAPLIINADDQKGRELLLEYSGAISYGVISKNARMNATTWDEKNTLYLFLNNREFICNSLYGKYNASNVLAAISLAMQIGISHDDIKKALQSFEGVPGRLQEIILHNGACVIIDYAHNSSSYEVLLSCLRKKTDHLIVVFGAGGGKDVQKRPDMGTIAAFHADMIIITQDNPRYEHQPDIVTDIMRTMTDVQEKKVVIIDDRQQAIQYACDHAQKNSIVAILGKGNDYYQEINGVKYFFSDEFVVRNRKVNQ